MDRLTKAMDKYLSDVTKVTEQQMVNFKLASKALDMAEHRKRLLFLKARSFKVRIPRKLKKAAKYGIERRVYPADENEISPITLVLKHAEKVVFVIVGKRTKWKQKACLACMREERRRLIRLWEKCDRILLWGV